MSEAANQRRLTDAEEQRGADLFAAGRSEREVATALGISASTAHRLRERLQQSAAGGLEITSVRRALGSEVILTHPGLAEIDADLRDTELAAIRAELLNGLAEQRDEQAAVLESWQARAAASQGAIAALDAERLELLAAGQDAAPLRARRADAVADLADASKAGEFAAARLAETDAQIAAVRAEIDAAAREVARREAAALAAELAPEAAAALREAVTGDGTVKALTGLATRLAQAEQASGTSWDFEVLPPPLFGLRPDRWYEAVSALWTAARRGDLTACQALASRCGTWQQRDRAEQERLRAEAGEQLRQAGEEAAARLRQSIRGGGPVYMPVLPNSLPGAVASARTGAVYDSGGARFEHGSGGWTARP